MKHDRSNRNCPAVDTRGVFVIVKSLRIVNRVGRTLCSLRIVNLENVVACNILMSSAGRLDISHSDRGDRRNEYTKFDLLAPIAKIFLFF